jgi:hypothetical protein
MNAIRTFAALSLAALVTACASPGAMDAAPAAGMSPGMSHAGTAMPMAPMDPRMEAMQDMHQKMMSASSPAERQALMADHMKAMQDGLAMMKEKHDGMHEGMAMMKQKREGKGGMGGMEHGKGMQAGMGKRHQMMTEHMATMQLLMDMMMEHMPASSAVR